jgi:RNA recognition motif-containing protein
MRQARNPKEYKIHVGPLPRTTTVEELLSHFQRFGEVYVIAGKPQRGRARTGHQLDRGSCTLVARSEQTARSIISARVQYFRGRKITCEPFIESSHERQLHNQRANNRRIVAKNIPADVDEEKLKEFFSAFGEVVYAYFLKPSASSGASLCPNRPQTASVQFDHEAPAATLVAAKQVELQGVLVSLERYDPQYQSRSQGSSHALLQPSAASQPQPKPAPDPTLGQGPAARPDSHVISGHKPCLKSKVPQLIHQQSQESPHVFVRKPTSKSYHHTFHEQYKQYHSTQNLRFNIPANVIASSPPANHIK